MKKVYCYNLKDKRCKVLAVKGCPSNCPKGCSSRVTDPAKYIKTLRDILNYNKANPQFCAAIRREIREVQPDWTEEEDEQYKDWQQVYREDLNRGDRGGASESDANNKTSIKQKMKDNRPIECKQSQAERDQVKQATKEWEEEHGKLDKLSRMPYSRNKVDSYTGEPIE